MKKRRIAAALLSAALVTALGCSTAFAANPSLFSPYTRYYGHSYGDTSTQHSDSWMRMEYVTGTNWPGSDAAARTSVYTAPGINGYAYVRAYNEVGAGIGREVSPKNSVGWTSTEWDQGALNGTPQDDFCIRVKHTASRSSGDYHSATYYH